MVDVRLQTMPWADVGSEQGLNRAVLAYFAVYNDQG